MRSLPGLPLLAKEVLQLTARRRTYIIRAVFAVLVLLGFSIVYLTLSWQVDPMLGMLGQGESLFEILFALLFSGIVLVMPAMCAGIIAHEKESGTLVLLLLTPIRPWKLVAEKFASQVLKMGNLLLLSLPLSAVAYSLGGMSAERLLTGVMLLVITVLQVAALTLATSAWCRRAITAFFISYAALAVMYAAMPVVGLLMFAQDGNLPHLCPAVIFSQSAADGMPDVATLIPPAVSIVVLLGLARFALIRRAMHDGGSPVLRWIFGVEGWIRRIERRHGPSTAPALPEARAPWREAVFISCSRWSYRKRVFLPVHAVLITVLMTMASLDAGPRSYDLLFCGVFSLAACALLSLGAWASMGRTVAAAVAGEPASEAVPPTIVTANEKLRSLRLVGRALVAMLLMIIAFRWHAGIDDDDSVWWAWSGSLLVLPQMEAALLVLPAATWMAVAFGRRLHDGGVAVALAFAAVALWNLDLPLVLAAWLDAPDRVIDVLSICTPGSLVGVVARDAAAPVADERLLPHLVAWVLYGCAWAFFRSRSTGAGR